MKRNMKYGLLLLAVLAFAGLALAQTGYIQFDQGRKNMTVQSGGTVTVASGGILDVASGGALKIAGTQITPTAAQYNYLAGVTAGTVLASKAVVVGANKEVNELRIDSLTSKRPVVQITDDDSLLAAEAMGQLYYARPLAAKKKHKLPDAAVGLSVEYYVEDADSLLVAAAAGDTLIFTNGTAAVTTSTVAGTIKLVAIDTVRWVAMFATGTWTSY